MNEEVLTAAQVLEDPATSWWLKEAVQMGLQRDPVDALNDAIALAAVMDSRLRAQLGLDEEDWPT